MKTLYQADDGILFDSYEECAEYEHNQVQTPILKEINAAMIFMDCNGQVIEWGTIAAHNLERCYHRSRYLKLIDYVSDWALQWVRDELGFTLPQKRGLYRYDDYNDEWESYENTCEEYNSKWSIATGITLK